MLDEVRSTELARAVAIDDVASGLGLEAGCSLRELSELAPSPWNGIFAEHRAAFLELTEEITVVAHANRELVSNGQRAVAQALQIVGDANRSDPFDAARPNAPGGRRTDPILVDEVI